MKRSKSLASGAAVVMATATRVPALASTVSRKWSQSGSTLVAQAAGFGTVNGPPVQVTSWFLLTVPAEGLAAQAAGATARARSAAAARMQYVNLMIVLLKSFRLGGTLRGTGPPSRLVLMNPFPPPRLHHAFRQLRCRCGKNLRGWRIFT